MRNLAGRLQKLERRLGLGPETEQERQWRERFEAFLQRRAEWRAHEGLPPLETDERPRKDLSGLTIADILQRARARLNARRDNV